MCLSKPILINNKEPIVCYKILRQSGPWFNRKLSAVFFDYNYFLGVTHVQSDKQYHINCSFEPSIGGGYFHSFANLNDAQACANHRKNYDNNLVIVECEIPAKTKVFGGEFEYYYGFTKCLYNSYASKAIIIKKIINKIN